VKEHHELWCELATYMLTHMSFQGEHRCHFWNVELLSDAIESLKSYSYF